MKKEKTNKFGGESYVLRLYRRDSLASKPGLVGLLEDPLSGQQWPFHSMDELSQLLRTPSLIETNER